MFNPALPALVALSFAFSAAAQQGTPVKKASVDPAQADPAQADPAQAQGDPKQKQNGTSEHAVNPKRPIPPGCWFDKLHIGFGKFHEKAGERLFEGIYKFENKTDKACKVTAVVPSCKCQKLKVLLQGKEIVLKTKDDVTQMLKEPFVVPAGGKGQIVMKFDISGGPGPRTGDIRFETTDPAMPSLTLTCDAQVLQSYDVQPSLVNLGQMGPKEKRDWACKVRCIVRKEWKVTKPAPPLPFGVTVSSIERNTDKDGVFYEIKGSYGPNLEEGAMGGLLVFHTDEPTQNFQLEIRADVREKVKLSPRFFSFSRFPRAEAQERTIHLWPTSDKEGLEIERVEIERCSVPKEFVEIRVVAPKKLKNGDTPQMVKLKGLQDPVPAHRLWKVVVRLKGDIPGRVIRGSAKVFLKGEGFVPKPFSFNGFPKG